jgi:hypothetical protein
MDEDQLNERYWELIEKFAEAEGMSFEDFVTMVVLKYGPPPAELN